ncbi:TetR/AcrR family transcriptional regulator [Microbacterium sp. BWT-B31]|uniref:TetR/AcrR family transcriptional regulator n=1 Tax=Microbacterium sp. BWT-B31 TaxID=3232072 RepID=UPI0035272F5F
MPKISEARRVERRSEIMDAALRCFLRTGYNGTSMADIIAESGLSAGAIYSYFPGKQQLVRAVAERILDARRTELEAASAQRALSPAGVVRVLAQGVRANAPLPVLLQVWGEATVDPELRAAVQSVLLHMRATIAGVLGRWAEGHADELPLPAAEWAAVAAPVVMGMIPSFLLQSVLVDGFDDEAFLRGVDLVLPSHP